MDTVLYMADKSSYKIAKDGAPDRLPATLGNRIDLTGGSNDMAFGHFGNEPLILSSYHQGHMTVDGGKQVRFLPIENTSAPTLDLTQEHQLARVSHFSSIDLTGTTDNTIKLNWQAVATLAGVSDVAQASLNGPHWMVLSANRGDTLQLVDLSRWQVGAEQTADELHAAHGGDQDFLPGHTYKAYTLDGATVYVDQAMSVSTTTSTPATTTHSQALSIENLFGPPDAQSQTPFMDSPTAITPFGGVAIVFAGSADDVHLQGRYQLSKDGGGTWTDVPADLSDSNALYADKSALIRFAGAIGLEVIKPSGLSVRLMAPSLPFGTEENAAELTGAFIDASRHNGDTPFFGETLTMRAASVPIITLDPDDRSGLESVGSLSVASQDAEALADNPQGPAGTGLAEAWHATLDLTNSSVLALVKDYSSIDLTGTLNNTLKVDWSAIATLSETMHTGQALADAPRMLVISGNAGDALQLVNLNQWTRGEVQTTDSLTDTYGSSHSFLAGHAYRPYALNGVFAFVDEAIAVNPVTDAVFKAHQPPSTETTDGHNAPGQWATEEQVQLALSERSEADTDLDVTPQDVANAIALSVQTSMTQLYSLHQGDNLNLSNLVKNAFIEGLQASPAPATGLTADSEPQLLHLTLADVLSVPATNGVHQLTLGSDAHNKLVLTQGEWTDTGNVVHQDGHSYAVFSGSTDASAQLLIDQQALNGHLFS